MIPLRDRNPTRRTPWVTIALIAVTWINGALGLKAAERR